MTCAIGLSVEPVTCLPMLTKAQVYECLAYCEDHRSETDLLVAREAGRRMPNGAARLFVIVDGHTDFCPDSGSY